MAENVMRSERAPPPRTGLCVYWEGVPQFWADPEQPVSCFWHIRFRRRDVLCWHVQARPLGTHR